MLFETRKEEGSAEMLDWKYLAYFNAQKQECRDA